MLPKTAALRTAEFITVRPRLVKFSHARCRNRNPRLYRARQCLPRRCTVPSCRTQLARRQPIADAATPPIEPVPATTPAPEIVPFSAPPETATRGSRQAQSFNPGRVKPSPTPHE